jgi:hypothetical protein
MEETNAYQLAREIVLRNAKDIDVQDVSTLVGDIEQAIQAERDVFSARIQITRPEPGDIVIVNHPRVLSNFAKARITYEFTRLFPMLKIIVLDDGLTVSRLIRPTEALNEQ